VSASIKLHSDRFCGSYRSRQTRRFESSGVGQGGSHPWKSTKSVGWLAEQFMKSNMGLLMNIVLGIVGAAVANWLVGFLGISLTGWIGYLIAGFIGACILIAVGRALSGAFQRT
jgi:uncharacterized membrane protein YeaQ/YmgE (transglycosylase-associated protein family)